MSAEIRHGPVTMHRAVERAMMKTLRTRPPDTPRQRPGAADGDDASAAESPRPGAARPTIVRGARRDKPPGSRRDGAS